MTSEQLDCLCSPVRVNLYEAIQQRKYASVVELADDMGKSVHSLYFHLRLLENAGLIRIREYRRVGKRDEAVYEAVSDRLVIEKDNSNPAYVEGLVKTVRIALRKAEREHAAARNQKVDDELFAVLRLQANLSYKDAELLRKKIRDLGTWVRRQDRSMGESDTQGIAITCLSVPIGKS